MPECAFCDHQGKLSKEHIVSDWMEKLFPGKLRIRRTTGRGDYHQRESNKINWQEKVVCEPCNNTWMSRIEDEYAQPVMTPFITVQMDIPIGINEARSLAMFAFKTAAVLNYANPRDEYFFSREERHQFRKDQSIPRRVNMWLAAFPNHRGSGRFITLYHEGDISPTHRLKMYICTFAIGNLVIQVVSANDRCPILVPEAGFESLAVPLWPDPSSGYVWPGSNVNAGFLIGINNFKAFASRWRNVAFE